MGQCPMLRTLALPLSWLGSRERRFEMLAKGRESARNLENFRENPLTLTLRKALDSPMHRR
jgi:hypothetical protein